MKCPMCNKDTEAKAESFYSNKIDSLTKEPIVVKDILIMNCTDEACGFTWLPMEQEKKLDKEIARRQRNMILRKVSEILVTIAKGFVNFLLGFLLVSCFALFTIVPAIMAQATHNYYWYWLYLITFLFVCYYMGGDVSVYRDISARRGKCKPDK